MLNQKNGLYCIDLFNSTVLLYWKSSQSSSTFVVKSDNLVDNLAKMAKTSFLRRPWSHDLGSTRTLVTLLRLQIRRLTIIISAW